MACGQRKPEKASVVCDSTVRNHPTCTGWDNERDSYVDWPNELYVEPKKTSTTSARAKVSEIATRVAPAKRVEDEGITEAMEGSARAADAWDEAQKQQVLAAIREVATEHEEFTVDAVWAKLDGAVPITKGIASLMRQASKQGICDSTGKRSASGRGRDTTRELTVWYSLIRPAARQ